MYIERIYFDEVFDVQAARGDFSFRSQGHPQYGVNLGNRVVPRAGSTYAVAFGKPGDWSIVLGSRDLASSVVFRQLTWSALLIQVLDFFLFGPLFVIGSLLLGGSWLAAVATALFLMALAYVVLRAVRDDRAVTRALLAVGQDEHRDKDGADLHCTV
ncbi:hypothetical protein LK542_23500 [Massilia sp. IC2-477]|uniref:hypothetical protein n=1 Tax=Massilia sp. IC2-477 TaxID=2887198 RepID=UPI001D12F3D6|nr:hypothetical protein [Massilia sp. IC2-477]MCC2958580.1 hypothetical protein [Massilia sp. IC2-477]